MTFVTSYNTHSTTLQNMEQLIPLTISSISSLNNRSALNRQVLCAAATTTLRVPFAAGNVRVQVLKQGVAMTPLTSMMQQPGSKSLP